MALWPRVGAIVVAVACLGEQPARAQPVTVAVDLGTLDATAFDQLGGVALEQRLVVRLVQDGFAVTTVAQHPTIIVTVERTSDRLVLTADGPLGRKTRSLVIGTDELPVFHLEVAQKVAELVRTSLPAPTPTPSPSPSPSPADAQKADNEIVASLGGLAREGGIDVDLLVAFRGRAAGGLGVIGSVAFVPSAGPGLEVHEWQFQGGISYRIWLGAAALDVGATAGAVLEVLSKPDATGVGSSGDLLVSVPVQLTFGFGDHWVLGARAAAGTSTRSQRQSQGSMVVWERGTGRVDAGVVFGRSW